MSWNDVRDRILSGDLDECWPWIGACINKHGNMYGYWKGTFAHVVVYRALGRDRRTYNNNPNLFLHRTCGVTFCVNPHHCIVLPMDENIRARQALDTSEVRRAELRAFERVERYYGEVVDAERHRVDSR